MKVIGIIPARMGSSRFPGKPLENILGHPMIEHVYKRSQMSSTLDELYLATPDEEIKEVTERFGGHVIMTSPLHERCNDRVAEAVQNMDADIVVTIQGDEPMITPEIIDLTVSPLLKDDSIYCAHAISRIHDPGAFNDRNEAKVVCNQQGYIMYISREPIPTTAKNALDIPMLKLINVIPYRKDFLIKYTHLDQTPLEQAESMDMLRVLEHGYQIKAVEIPYKIFSVDTPGDMQHVQDLMREDPLLAKYL